MRQGSAKLTVKPQANDFKAWGELLLGVHNSAFDSAEVRKPRRPRKEPSNAFKLAAYKYMWLLERRELAGELLAYLDQRDGRGWRRNSDSLATAVVRLATEEMSSQRMRQIRSRIAFDLRLAWINKIKLGCLIGFLHEAGTEAVIKKDVARKKRYSWAKHYR
jgi:hypothetical protein